MTNFQRTAAWLNACGKKPNTQNLTIQTGCHLEEFAEFLDAITIIDEGGTLNARLVVAAELLTSVASNMKRGYCDVLIAPGMRQHALDALCDMEVTGNGVAYLAGFDKDGADQAVLASNEAKLVDGKPVILEGGKIGKPAGWTPPDLTPFV